MKRNLILIGGLAALVIATYLGFGAANQQNTAQAEAPAASAGEVNLESEKAKLGYMFGFQIATNMKQDGIAEEIDLDAFYAAQREILSGKESRMTMEEMQATQMAFMAKKQAEAQAIADENKSKGEDYLKSNKDKKGVVVTESGLQYEVLREGKGKQPAAENSVVVHYQGTLIDGTVFDSSYERNQPATFAVNGVIPGFSEGILLMKEGAKNRLTIPAGIAYGEQGPPSIGPNQVLVFEVELIEVK